MVTSFDEKISSSVSLSRVFDCLVADGESPLVLLNFLDEHRDAAADILLLSDYSPRILSFDFLEKCSVSQTSILASIVVDMLARGGAYVTETKVFLHQVLLRNNAASSTAKNIFREKLREADLDVVEASPEWRLDSQSKLTARFDERMFRFSDASEFADVVNEVSPQLILSNVDGTSLVLPRLVQDDVFMLLSPLHQWALLGVLGNIGDSLTSRWSIRIGGMYPLLPIVKGLKILLGADVDITMKTKIYGVLNSFPHSQLAKETDSLLRAANMTGAFEDDTSFGQIVMKMLLRGETEMFSWVVLAALFRYGKDFLLEDFDSFRDMFSEKFDMVDLLDSMRSVEKR